MKPDYFYDRHLKLWTLLWLDPEGNQIGEAEYFTSQEKLDAGIVAGHHEHYKSYIKALEIVDLVRYGVLDAIAIKKLDEILQDARQRGINTYDLNVEKTNG